MGLASAIDQPPAGLPAADYAGLGSLVARLASRARPAGTLTAEEQRNLDCFLAYKAAPLRDRPLYRTATFKGHRRGIVHLPELAGTPGRELDHDALLGRTDEIDDVIVKDDRLWAVFRLKARHVGALYGMPGHGGEIEMTEMCVLRFEDGKIAEGWFFADELALCRQIGVPVCLTAAPR